MTRPPILRQTRARLAQAAWAALALCGISGAQAQGSYPNRTITLVAPFSAGGDADLAGRNFAAAAQRVLGQTVVVINKTGASGVIGSAQVVAAAPDGYTLLLARTGSQAIMPAIQPTSTKYKWDDYTFIGMLELNPYGCTVGAKSPYRKFDDLAQAIRTKGKSLNFGTAGILTTNDMGPRQLFRLLKISADQAPTQIPYKGTGEATLSLIAGETEFACGSMGPFISHIKAGTLRALMVTTTERMPELPDVPTARELGYAEMEKLSAGAPSSDHPSYPPMYATASRQCSRPSPPIRRGWRALRRPDRCLTSSRPTTPVTSPTRSTSCTARWGSNWASSTASCRPATGPKPPRSDGRRRAWLGQWPDVEEALTALVHGMRIERIRAPIGSEVTRPRSSTP